MLEGSAHETSLLRVSSKYSNTKFQSVTIKENRMKSANQFARFAFTALCLLAFASASFAAKSNPLNEPNGLAVDASGNLYVANTGTNSILVFDSKYKQVTTATITAGVDHPTAVAVDPEGNVWVANYIQGAGSITEYTAGKQDTAATITEGVASPLALAVDGLGNVWIQNAGTYVDVYAQPAAYGGKPSLVQTFNVDSPLHGIAVQENSVGLAAESFGVGFASVLSTISSGTFLGVTSTANNSGAALAGDGKGNFYSANFDGSVNIVFPQAGVEGVFAQLGFAPAGMAVDRVNNRIYFSYFQGNYILVYSTITGQLLETIK